MFQGLSQSIHLIYCKIESERMKLDPSQKGLYQKLMSSIAELFMKLKIMG